MDATTRAALHTIQASSDLNPRYNAFLQLAHGGNGALLPLLVNLLGNAEDWGIRQGAAWTLGQLRLNVAIPALTTCITREDEDEQVRYVAALAMAFIGGNTAKAALHTLTSHEAEPVRRVAQAALNAVPYINVS